MYNLKRTIKQTLRRLGLEVHRFTPGSSRTARLIAAMDSCGINTVLDVGANEGQFGEELRIGGFTGRIVSFEPMADAYGKLLKRSLNDPHWKVAPRCAIGTERGTVELNVAGNSVSSSLLPMLEAHRAAAPQSAYSRREPVTMLPLDEAAPPFLDDSGQILLKIDTQGYEWQVLDGAPSLLARSCAVLIELSLVPLYEGQSLWHDCVSRLEKAGFTIWSMEPEFIDSKTGRTLQINGLFIRI